MIKIFDNCLLCSEQSEDLWIAGWIELHKQLRTDDEDALLYVVEENEEVGDEVGDEEGVRKESPWDWRRGKWPKSGQELWFYDPQSPHAYNSLSPRWINICVGSDETEWGLLPHLNTPRDMLFYRRHVTAEEDHQEWMNDPETVKLVASGKSVPPE